VRQIVFTRYGGPDVFHVHPAADPEPGPDAVRIAVRAIGVNFADILARVGLYPDGPSPPAVLGYEVAGVIDAVGSSVHDRQVGDRVLALTKFGGYSTCVVVPSAHALPIPSRLSDVEAAAIPVNYLTAFIALYKLGNLEAGETVLVHGAGGGVGIAAIQLAQLRNARIIGTASTIKHEAIRKFGIEHLIDPSRTDVIDAVRQITGGRGVDVVLDSIGGRHYRDSYRLLAPLGRLVVFGASGVIGERRNWLRVLLTLAQMPTFRPLSLINTNRGVLGLNLGRLWTEQNRIAAFMAAILEDVQAGRLQPVIAATFPFEKVADAHRFLHARSNVGKVVLTVE
jgi:NADPH:quinone reductase-like Zn-dependent oxidoreductase